MKAAGCPRPSCRGAISCSSPTRPPSATAAACARWSAACARPIFPAIPTAGMTRCRRWRRRSRWAWRRVTIETPLMWIDKAGTWELADQLGGSPLVELIVEETHTCYLGIARGVTNGAMAAATVRRAAARERMGEMASRARADPRRGSGDRRRLGRRAQDRARFRGMPNGRLDPRCPAQDRGRHGECPLLVSALWAVRRVRRCQGRTRRHPRAPSAVKRSGGHPLLATRAQSKLPAPSLLYGFPHDEPLPVSFSSLALAPALAERNAQVMPDQLTFGYEDEGKVDASPSGCEAFVKENIDWPEPEMSNAYQGRLRGTQAACRGLRRHSKELQSTRQADRRR